jgi:hypothetical protein
LKKLKFPLPKDNVYQVWLNLASWFWRRRFFEIFSVYLLFCYYLPLEMGNPLYLDKLESPQGWFVPSLVKIGSMVLEKKSKM